MEFIIAWILWKVSAPFWVWALYLVFLVLMYYNEIKK